MTNFRLLLLIMSCMVHTKRVPVYFLHAADFSLATPVTADGPDRDCLHTLKPRRFPPQVTVCQRTMHYTFMRPGNSYAFGFSFGTLLPDWSDIEQGWLYGEWETGPWWGFRTKEKEVGKFGWLGLGEGMRSDHMVWRHTCCLIDFKAGRVALFENGKKYFDKTDLKDVQETYKANSKEIEIVTAGCTYRGSTSLTVHGKVTDFQMWDTVLPDQELEEITGCRKFREGNLVSWEGEKWFLNSSRGTARMETADLESEVCRSRAASFHVVPHVAKMEPQALQMCARFSGQVAQYSSKEKFDSLTGFLSARHHRNLTNCLEKVADKEAWKLRVWTANTDSEEEGVWRDRYSGQAIEHAPWPADRPYDGGFAYNCMMLEVTLEEKKVTPVLSSRLYFGSQSLSGGTIQDEECSTEYCSVCEVASPSRKMSVRGLCPLSPFDSLYTYVVTEQGTVMYLGYWSSVILYDKEKSAWMWYDRKDNRSVASSSAPESSLLLGLHTVDFSRLQGDKCRGEGGGALRQVKVTTCGQGEFTCSDGQCIGMEQRCDQTINCDDKSDEQNCVMVNMEDNYNKKIAPFSFDKVKKRTVPVGINVSMAVTDIIKIEEVDHVYTLKFRLVLEWFDFRLQYYNLKNSRSQNALALEEVQGLWIPFLVFDNTENNEATRGTEDTEVTITREADLIRASTDVVDEINIFDGQQNRITFEQVYTKTFKCTYQLQMYPFDTQVCSVNLKVRKLETAVMRLLPLNITMESETVLTQYIIKKWSLGYIDPNNVDKGVELVIVFRRRIMNAILTVYLPTVLILTIVYATNFFKDFFFEAVVTVNLTALLVLTTLFISVSGSLPQTAYVKMIDIWLIFSQMLPWIMVLVHTLIDFNRTDGGEEGEGREINHHGTIITVGADSAKGKGSTVDLELEDELFKKRKKKDDQKNDKAKIQVDEKKMVKARKDFYDNSVTTHANIVDKLKFLNRYVIPIAAIAFSLLYWAYGLVQYYQ